MFLVFHFIVICILILGIKTVNRCPNYGDMHLKKAWNSYKEIFHFPNLMLLSLINNGIQLRKQLKFQ